MQRKSIKIWIVLLVAPYLLLILVALIQFAVHFALNSAQSHDNGLAVAINILSIVVGIAAVLLILGMPIWIILLIKTISDNKSISSQQPQYSQAPSPHPPKTPLDPGS